MPRFQLAAYGIPAGASEGLWVVAPHYAVGPGGHVTMRSPDLQKDQEPYTTVDCWEEDAVRNPPRPNPRGQAGHFGLCKYSDNQFITSPDLVTWTNSVKLPESCKTQSREPFRGLAYGHGRWVAVTKSNIITSTDGLDVRESPPHTHTTASLGHVRALMLVLGCLVVG